MREQMAPAAVIVAALLLLPIQATERSPTAPEAGCPQADAEAGRPASCEARGSSLIQLKPALSKLAVMDDEIDSSGYEPVAVQKRMPAAGYGTSGATATGCPHMRSGLGSFSALVSGSDADVTLPSGSAYLFDTSATVKGLTIPQGAELIFADKKDLVLTAAAVHVQGKLLLGAETCPLKSSGIGITLTGVGDKAARSSDPLRTKGVTVSPGGVLEMFGTRYAPTWTRLAASAAPGSTTLELEDAVDWEVGQNVVVVTTAWTDEPGDHQNEVRQLTAVSGRTLTLDSPLSHGHYGGPEYSAEVALLSRSITVQGDAGSEQTRYGGHTICIKGSQCRIGGVAAYRMGQENTMGRYPFHLHMMGDINGESYFQDNLVLHSYFRAYTVHGTSKARVSRNVAYDISGSAYYLEDGIEEDNVFEFNLAAFINIIKQLSSYEGSGGQEGVTLSTETGRLVPTDATAVGFYCTNAKNRWIGNSASGGFSGFHFPTVPAALGDSYKVDPSYTPDTHELLEFDSNTAHSSGRLWSRGACMYVGGKLWEDNKGSNQYRYQTGRASPPRKSGRFLFTNTKVFACKKGMLFWGTHWSAGGIDLGLEKFEAHDVSRSSSQLGETYIYRAVISAQTGNTFASDLPKVADGFELYDTDMQTVLSDVTFRNFNRPGDVCIMDMTHSNIFKPQGMFNAKALRFEGTPRNQRFRHVHRLACKTYHQDTCKNNCNACPGTAGSSQIANIVDSDGSSLGWSKGGAILGADDVSAETNGRTNDWWRIDDSCVHEQVWGFWACPTDGHRAVVSLFILKGLHSSAPGRTTASTAVGRLYHFGHADRHLDVGLAQSPMVSGPCCDVAWYLSLDSGAEQDLTVFMDQMVTAGGLVFATSYPAGATFTVQRCLPKCSDVSQGASLQEVLDAPGTVYYVDGKGRLFLKLLFEGNGWFSAAGIDQLANGNRYLGGQGARYTIRSSRSGLVGFDLPAHLSTGIVTPTSQPTTTLPTTTPPPDATCKELWEGCGAERCCNGGLTCYEKDQNYAQCRPSCTPGISPSDPPQYQTPWSCNVLTRGGATTTQMATTTPQTTAAPAPPPPPPQTTAAPAPPPPQTTAAPAPPPPQTTTAPAPPPQTTAAPAPTPPSSCPTAKWGNCKTSLCCKDSDVTCYEKDQYYAQCRPSCTPGINPDDQPEYQTPWSCKVLGGAAFTTIAAATTTATTTTTMAPTTRAPTTGAPVAGLFVAVDGGTGRVCRGSTSSDNQNSYYKAITGVSTMEECKQHCIAEAACVGIEHSQGGRCEVWTRTGGIGASSGASGYTCLRYLDLAKGSFADIDGGLNRVCRGASSSDNKPEHYKVHTMVQSEEECKGICFVDGSCVGIEYAVGLKRCEVWTRPEGIGATKAVSGYSCLRFTRTLMA